MSQNSSNNDLEIMNRIAQKYFSEIEQYVPHFQQSLFDFQNEYYKTWKNIVTSNISLSAKLYSRFGFTFPESNKKLIENIADEIIRYRSLYHKIMIKSIESGKNNAKVWNDGADILSDLNQKILQSYISVFLSQLPEKQITFPNKIT